MVASNFGKRNKLGCYGFVPTGRASVKMLISYGLLQFTFEFAMGCHSKSLLQKRKIVFGVLYVQL